MKTKQLLSISIAGILATAPSALQAVDSPQQVIQTSAEKVRDILRKKTKKGTPQHQWQKAKLKKIVDDFVDYQELSRRSLGPHWNDRTSEQQKEFTSLLRDLIEESYTQPISNNIEFTMEYEDEEIAEDKTKATVWAIASAQNKKGKPVSEDLTFHLYLDVKKWMIYDIEFGDVSMVRHYRGEFNRKIKKESFKALMDNMRKKLSEIRRGKVKTGKQPTL